MSWDYYPNPNIRGFGVTCHSPSMNDLVETEKMTSAAFCNSRACAGSDNYSNKSCRKYVRNDSSTCPDCGHILFWKRVKA